MPAKGQGVALPLHPRHLPAELAQVGDLGLDRIGVRRGLLSWGRAGTGPGDRLSRQGLQLQACHQPAGKDQAFHQGIAGESVGTMHSSTSHFPHGIEARQTAGGLQVSADAAHPVVGCRSYGNRSGGGLQSQLPAATQDGWKLPFQTLLPDGTQVQPQMINPQGLHAPGQGAAHLVPGGQVPPRQMGHRAAAVAFTKQGPFAPDGFTDQEMGGPCQHQGGGMELHEFQIADPGPGAPGHGDAIATRLGRVGGVGKEMATATAGHHHGSGPQPAQPLAFQHLQANAVAVLQPKLEGGYPFGLGKQGAVQGFPFQGIHQGPAGAVLGMEHTAVAVGGLQGGAQTCPFPVEGHAQLQ